jgi:DNA polymerase III epsilon subunit-like protein
VSWKSELWCCLDVETTGLYPYQHGVVDVATVPMRGGRFVLKEVRRALVNPGQPIPAGASRIHGIRTEDVANKPSLHMMLPNILRHISQYACVVVYHAPFVCGFLRAAAVRHNYDALALGAVTTQALAGVPVFDALTAVRTPSVGSTWPRHRLVDAVRQLRVKFRPEFRQLRKAQRDAMMAGAVLWQIRNALPDDINEATQRISLRQEA